MLIQVELEGKKGLADKIHTGTASMGSYDFYTQNFLGAMNYSAF